MTATGIISFGECLLHPVPLGLRILSPGLPCPDCYPHPYVEVPYVDMGAIDDAMLIYFTSPPSDPGNGMLEAKKIVRSLWRKTLVRLGDDPRPIKAWEFDH